MLEFPADDVKSDVGKSFDGISELIRRIKADFLLLIDGVQASDEMYQR